MLLIVAGALALAAGLLLLAPAGRAALLAPRARRDGRTLGAALAAEARLMVLALAAILLGAALLVAGGAHLA